MKYLFQIFVLSLFFGCTTPTPSEEETSLVVKDSVHKILSQEKADQIYFKKHSAVYYLPKDSKNYSDLKAALEKSQKSGLSLHVKADPTTMEIQELVP